MKFTIRQIADLINGKVEGDDTLEINQFYKIEEGKEGGISFLANPKYENFIYETDSSAVIVADSFAPQKSIKSSLIKVKDPYASFTLLLGEYEKLIKARKSGIEEPVYIAKDFKAAQDIYIGAFTSISSGVKVGKGCQIHSQVRIEENVQIGDNCVIHSGVKILKDTVIGDNCVIHAGAVIGCDGFGFAPQADGTYDTIPQLGNVTVGNNVSIGANSTIDRATMGSTVISDGVKIDNLVQIAHNVTIGKNTVIAAQTGVAGSTKIGAGCVVGGQVGFVGHIEIADGTKIGAQTGVNSSIKEKGTSIAGTPHDSLKRHLKSQVYLRKLPEIIRDIEAKTAE
ncbi:UDP-3-O-(3-hydroxymyristoyl)glucosamine N-acyltransferase [Jiulongibacter sp. NS-SX5]|uniref:UDP-3-O-(3-hydroxymyristoyl)glucosamine N-acyltransferase n=1 Tax=Jiulongibacter sp. NS-SX5 TaxID=3463854 RepID=UPI004057D1A1